MKEIPNNDTFCILPWIHMQLDPSGAVQVCCASNYRDRHLIKTGDLNDSSAMQIWNNDTYRQLRIDMLNKKKNWKICGSCYERDKSGVTETERKRFNERFKHLGDIVESTKEDGSLDTIPIKYLDLRFSNLCNLKCRTCGSDWSSSIAAEQKQLKPDNAVALYNKSWKKIEEHLDGLEELYFAGGEPLLMPEHYDFLQSLIDNDRTDITILYNTNMTRLGIKNKNVIDYWKNFNWIGVAISLDHYGEYADYVRGGSQWDDILNNIKIIQDSGYERIDIGVSTVLSLYNVLHFGDFVIQLFENKILNSIDKFYIQQLVNPIPHQANNLSDENLERALSNINKAIDYLISINQDPSKLKSISSWLKNTNKYDQTQFDAFKTYNSWLDSMRGTNFEQTYPEYK